MKAVTLGTEYLRDNSQAFLPLEPREDYDAYLARVNRAVFSPYTQRLVRAATGLILRKPITLVGDPYWTDVFAKDVDGCGSDLDEYARRNIICSLTYGHSHVLVDFPAPTGALSLAEERPQNRKPYWIEIDPTNIYGWSKQLAEEYGLKANEKFVALRYFNVYGPGEQHKGKMASVVYQAYKKGSFTLFPKNPKRDFIYIDDVVAANLAAFKLDRGVFDVGYGEATPFEDLVSGMGIEFNYTTEDKIPGWYQFYTCADKNIRIPGWEPKYNVKQGTKNYVNKIR